MNRYTQQLVALQPPGSALPTEPTSNWVQLLDAVAQEFDRIHQRADALTLEVLLQQGEELLDLWETALGLPDPCAPAITDPDLRRQRIRTKLAETGGQSEAYFIDLAQQLGLYASITTFAPFEMGVSGMGDPVGGGDWRLVWQVNFLGNPDPERVELIKCIVSEAAPAHTQVMFSIGGIAENVIIYYNGQVNYDGSVRYGG